MDSIAAYTSLQQCLPLAVLKPIYCANTPDDSVIKLQQCLPLAVLKHEAFLKILFGALGVATVLTACGIETDFRINMRVFMKVATVLTACGIETIQNSNA